VTADAVAVGAAGSPPRRRGAPPNAVLGLLGLLGLVAVLELVPRMGIVDSRFLPPFHEIGQALWE
jgi:ABC-type nitrate/sulfonate/bicarbonate transport system permease component